MALRSDELHHNLQHLNGMLTTHEAAKQLDLSYWHFMHLVEKGRIPGVRVVDRWLFSPIDLNEYRRSRYGELEDMEKWPSNIQPWGSRKSKQQSATIWSTVNAHLK